MMVLVNPDAVDAETRRLLPPLTLDSDIEKGQVVAFSLILQQRGVSGSQSGSPVAIGRCSTSLCATISRRRPSISR
jgi:hypothetical protein